MIGAMSLSAENFNVPAPIPRSPSGSARWRRVMQASSDRLRLSNVECLQIPFGNPKLRPRAAPLLDVLSGEVPIQRRLVRPQFDHSKETGSSASSA